MLDVMAGSGPGRFGSPRHRIPVHKENEVVKCGEGRGEQYQPDPSVGRPEIGVAELLQLRGKAPGKFGYTAGPKTFLHPEEALFLVETERLVGTGEHCSPRHPPQSVLVLVTSSTTN